MRAAPGGVWVLRGLHHLLRGDVAAMLGFNALLVVASPVVVWGWVAWVVPRLRGPDSFALARPLLLVVVAYWLARNLAWFDWLAPSAIGS